MSQLSQPVMICLTPVKNEAWILDRFLRCASLWADRIIVADQGSDDDSVAIARRFPKVTLIENNSPTYDEGARQRLLLEAARRIPGQRILIALDADEMLTANWSNSSEWSAMRAASPGTVIRFQWVNLRPDLETCWLGPRHMPLGLVDDNSEHVGGLIHSNRLPVAPKAPSFELGEIKVLHYQYTDWPRMESKQRWYQCWEQLRQPRRPAQIYRQYHFMHAIPATQVLPVRTEWFDDYRRQGIDLTSTCREGSDAWDRQVLQMIQEHGPATFRRINIWDVDWARHAIQAGMDRAAIRDPRSWLDRAVLRWLGKTQQRYTRPFNRLVQWLLRFVGW